MIQRVGGHVLGDAHKEAPFFRIPGFARSPAGEQAITARGLVVFSTDADDWKRIKPAQIVERAMARLKQRGMGILILHHDTCRRAVAALPCCCER